MTERLGDAPIEEKYRAQMQAIAWTLDDFLNDGARGTDRKTPTQTRPARSTI